MIERAPPAAGDGEGDGDAPGPVVGLAEGLGDGEGLAEGDELVAGEMFAVGLELDVHAADSRSTLAATLSTRHALIWRCAV